MKTVLVVLSLVLATATFGAVSDIGTAGLALVLFLAAVGAGFALSFARMGSHHPPLDPSTSPHG